MKKDLFIVFLYMLTTFLLIEPALSHANQISKKDSDYLAMDLFDEAARLSPKIMSELENSSSTPYIKVGNQNFYLNSHFWELVAAWLRIYKQEISKDCNCEGFVVEDIMQKVKDHKAGDVFSTFLSNKTTQLSGQGVYFFSKYGAIVTSLKIAAEVAETILSVFVGGKGIHILCNMIDGLILTSAKHIKSAFSKYKYGKNLSHSSLFLNLKNSWISFRIFKARKRVFFKIDNLYKLQEEKVQEVDSLGVKKKKRTKFIHRLDKALEKNDSKKIEKATKIEYKRFFGKRYKRFLFLFSRKYNPEYMYSKSDPFNPIFENKKGFPFLIQEGILNAVFESPSHKIEQNYKTDEIKEGIIEELVQSKKFSKKDANHLKKSLRIMLQDIDKVFDTSISSMERAITVGTMEIYLNLFLNHYLTISAKAIESKNEKTRIMNKIKIYYLKGQFNKEAQKFIDFLSIVSSSSNTQKISFYKYKSMETFLLFFSYFDKLKPLTQKTNSLDQFIEGFQDHLEKIKTTSLGREKSENFLSLNPFKKPIPKCYKFVEAR